MFIKIITLFGAEGDSFISIKNNSNDDETFIYENQKVYKKREKINDVFPFFKEIKILLESFYKNFQPKTISFLKDQAEKNVKKYNKEIDFIKK